MTEDMVEEVLKWPRGRGKGKLFGRENFSEGCFSLEEASVSIG